MTPTVRTKKTRAPRGKSKEPTLEHPPGDKEAELKMQGGKLVVRLSRESHPAIFDLDRLVKQIHKLIETHGRKRNTRDLCQFLQETEKSLQILLRNQLEEAMRKCLD